MLTKSLALSGCCASAPRAALLRRAPPSCSFAAATAAATPSSSSGAPLPARPPPPLARPAVAAAATTKTPNAYIEPAAPSGGAAAETPEQARMREQVTAFQQHQKEAPRLTPAQEARTLVATARHAVLSTLASSAAASAGAGAGHPVGSVVEFADDGRGGLLLSTSTLSPHTADLAADGRVGVTVQAPGFSSLQDARLSLSGLASPLTDPEEIAEAREIFLKKFPDAFYVDFGDFRWFRVAVAPAGGARLVGGFGRVATVPARDYLSADPDPVAPFTAPVAGHMNNDHGEDMLAMVRGSVPGAADAKGPVRMTRVDALGCDLAVGGLFGEGQPETRVRLPWREPATDRKALKDRIVELTKAGRAAAAAAAASGGEGKQ